MQLDDLTFMSKLLKSTSLSRFILVQMDLAPFPPFPASFQSTSSAQAMLGMPMVLCQPFVNLHSVCYYKKQN